MKISSLVRRGSAAAAGAAVLAGSGASVASAFQRLNAAPTHLTPTTPVRITFVTPRRLQPGEKYDVSVDYQKFSSPPGCAESTHMFTHVVAKGHRVHVVLRPYEKLTSTPWRKWCIGRYFASVQIGRFTRGGTTVQEAFTGRSLYVHR